MSLIKLFQIPAKIFKKDVITFLIIRRHDLGIVNEKLRYLAVRPNASLLHIRQKLWYLLDLPDYCEEILTLKTEHNEEIPLTYFRKGNDPQHPFILEVWPPEKGDTPSRLQMLTLGDKRSLSSECKTITLENGKGEPQKNRELSQDYLSNKSTRYDTLSYKKSELSCRMSTSTLFFKIHGKKSRDNFAHLLLKIQSDLTTLSSKLSNLEQRIPV
ncbi:uncharacterized protein LOC121733637 [Aricia agestis]|uniref:uncharacterized protein LOC121733637 n=1 Tax=Aricia agestis TaxID=91739 RepID=UPI001C209787|nr:uncharacterized protein LOC121733637 [Aricia agestis]